MYKTNFLLIEKCRTLRRKGFTLGDIIEATGLPKTTIYGHVRDISLSLRVPNFLKITDFLFFGL